MFVITALYWVFHRYARARTALLVAVVLATYWFAFLHMPGNPLTALPMAVQVLPMTYPLAPARPVSGHRLPHRRGPGAAPGRPARRAAPLFQLTGSVPTVSSWAFRP